MSEVQSNYPRPSDPVLDGIDMPKLFKSAQMGQSYLAGMGFAMIVMTIAPLVGYPLDKQEGILKSISSMSGVFGLLTAFQLFKWSSQAHRITCQLRSNSPKFSSTGIGIVCALSFLAFFIPLSHTLDFLIIRSASADGETMGWKSLASSSKLVNLFNVSIFVSFVVLGFLFVPNISETLASIVGVLSTAAFLSAMIHGAKIVTQVNKNLVDQIKIFKDQPMSPLAPSLS